MREEAVAGLAAKLQALPNGEQRAIIFALIRQADVNESLLSKLGAVVEALSPSALQRSAAELGLALDSIIRKAAYGQSVDTKLKVLRLKPELLGYVSQETRQMFFDDVLALADSSRFELINSVLPALVDAQASIPEALSARYVTLLLKQVESDAWYGKPAAQRALGNLPTVVATAFLRSLDPATALSRWQEVKKLVQRHSSDIPQGAEVADNVLQMEYDAFRRTYMKDDLSDT